METAIPGRLNEAAPCANVVSRPGRGYVWGKRCFDVVAGVLGLMLLFPAMLCIAYLVHREDGGPVTYISTRVGKGGRPIRIRKFRTMVPDAQNMEKYCTPWQLAQYHREFKLEKDPRVTKVGRLLRRFSLDELPQLVNVIQGDMSLVGPRPVVQEELKYYRGEERDLFLMVQPGLTGYWQVNGRNNAAYTTGERQALELYYVRNRSLWLDAAILYQTLGVVIKGVGAK